MKRSLFGLTLLFCLVAGCALLTPGEPRGEATPAAATAAAMAAPVPTATPAAPGAAASGAAASGAAASTSVLPTPTQVPNFTPLSVSAADCSYGGEFQAIEALDSNTVRFRLCRPDAAFLSKIAFPSFAIYAQAWLDQAGQAGFSLDQPVGTGPYRLSEWTRGEKLTFQLFDRYRQSLALVAKRLVFRWNLDSSARLVELQAGTVNGIDAVRVDDYATVSADSSQKLIIRPALNIAYLGMNNLHPPLDDERVRQAIAMGIDRQALLAGAFPGGYELADFFTPCIVPYACGGEGWWPYDPARAQDLLSQAGQAGGFTIELAYRDIVRGYLPQPDAVAKMLQAQLNANLKIQVKLRVLEDAEFYPALDAGELPGLYLLGWGADYPDITNFLDTHFGEQASLQFGNPFEDVLQALKQGAATADPAAREASYAAANTALRQHAPLVPLAHGGWIVPNAQAVAFSAAVQGIQVSPMGLEEFATTSLPGRDELVWMQSSEPQTLYCGAGLDVETLRACLQVAEPLYHYKPGGVTPEPALAEQCLPDSTLQVWTCQLRPGLFFQDGSSLDANDVVTSFTAQWQSGSALHVLQSDNFGYFKQFWGDFLP